MSLSAGHHLWTSAHKPYPCPEPFRSHRDLPVFDQGLEKLFCFSPIDRAGLDDGVQSFSLVPFFTRLAANSLSISSSGIASSAL